ncbi:MAG: autotransporter-associated beta strand repeat-containing protein, partial [Luteolibacter sp.]
MKSKNKTLQHLGFIALAFAGFAAPSAQAASQTWTNSASDLLWNTTSLDWTGAAWTNNNDAVFGATGVGSIAVASDVIVNDITFSTAGYTLTGNLMLANDQASTFTGTQNATISAIIANNTAGASSLTKAGANTLTISGANTYSGTTTISAGILSVGHNNALGTGSVAFNGGTLTDTTGVTLANNLSTTSATGTITSSGGTMVLNGTITGVNGLTLNPTNKITLAGTNNFATNTSGSFIALVVNAGAGGVDITGSTTLGTGGSGNNIGGFAMVGTSAVTLQSGGSLTINGSGTTATTIPNSIVGQNTVATSTVLVNGGTLTVGGSTGFILGNGNNNNIAAAGVLTISSGTATINRGSVGTTSNGTDTRLIMMGRDSTSSTGTINLNGGTLATDRQFVRDGSSTGQAGTANFVFGGGTLKALGAQTDWLQSTTATSGGQGGGTVNANAQALSSVTTTAVSTIDPNGFSVAINSSISGAGGFNINSTTGTGTVTFGGANTYTGPTTISAGRLNVISPGSINTSAVSLGAATLGGNGSVGAVTVNNTGAVITNGNSNTATLTLDSLAFTTGATLNLNKANDSTPALAITGNLATTAGITINIPAGPVWANGDYDLITFGSGPAAGATPNLTVGSIAGLGGRQSGTLSSTGSSIILSIGGDNPVWTGVGSQTWTTAATNNNSGPNAWALKTGHTATNFWANDSVEFNDTYRLNPSPSDVTVSNSTVTIHGGVAPASATFNNTSVNYVINSDDSTGITTGALSKNGDGNVTLTTTNSYTGPTIIT